MRVFKDDFEYQGTPEEIHQLFVLLEGNVSEDISRDDFAPVDLISESQKLREQLANDPNYNPHGGVIASPESEDRAPLNIPTAEDNTGVDLK